MYALDMPQRVTTAQLNVRIPVASIQALKKLAQRDHRSIAKEITHLIEQALRKPSAD